MRIYLLRHGRAEIGTGKPDADRALTEDGREKLGRAAAAWRRLVGPLEVVMTSPLLRARETAAVLMSALDEDPEVRIDEALTPIADPQLAIEIITHELQAGTESLTFVGHEPHLGELLGLLLTGEENRSVPLKKGMLVAVDLASSTSLVGSLAFALGQKCAAKLD